ncbi:MAG: FAD-dependent oxidoreductase [Bacteroidetes bacterium]|nr:FAD-dependent oxidoreductase [Bacteroidota bacterium]
MKLFLFYFLLIASPAFAQQVITTDVLVVGGGTGGTAAGISAARAGVKTIITEPTTMLGGMLTAAGVSCTDGNNLLHSGIWEEFRQALYKHYGTNNLASGWVSETCFEPHVADSIFKAWVKKEKSLTVMYRCSFEKTLKENNKITGAVFKKKDGSKIIVKAKITIDATELGDVFANAGVAYDIGTESREYSKENIAPEKTNIIQDITWAAVLKDYGAGSDKTIPKPAGYNETDYYCCCTSAPCKEKPYNADAKMMLDYGRLPNNKYMINWPAHGNDFYMNVIEDNETVRIKKYDSAKQHTLGFIYFIQTTLGYKNLGLADDELDNGLATIPYNREGRRMHGVVRFNINHILDPYNTPENFFRTGIAVGDYPVDHHHSQNPNTPHIDFPRIPSFNIPLGTLIPEKTDGLIVCEKGISVSNIVNGATRLQPVVLLTGQAAGILAAIAVKNNKQPRQVDVRTVQDELLRKKCYIMPFVDVQPESLYWQAIQRIGATGILKGFGKPEGWENKTFFYPDSTITVAEFEDGIKMFDPSYKKKEVNNNLLTIKNAMHIILKAGVFQFKRLLTTRGFPQGYFFDERFWKNTLHLQEFNPDRNIKRYELAVLLDFYTDPFHSR